jgi:hypothetical protein
MALPPAGGLGCLLLKIVFSDDGTTITFGHFDRPACINASTSCSYIDFYGFLSFLKKILIWTQHFRQEKV